LSFCRERIRIATGQEPATSNLTLIYSNDCNGINAGSFLVKCSPLGLVLLQKVWDGHEDPAAKWFTEVFNEQGVIQWLLTNNTDVAWMSQNVSMHEINSYWEIPCGEHYAEGDLVLHLVNWAKENWPRLGCKVPITMDGGPPPGLCVKHSQQYYEQRYLRNRKWGVLAVQIGLFVVVLAALGYALRSRLKLIRAWGFIQLRHDDNIEEGVPLTQKVHAAAVCHVKAAGTAG
jgi:hypothetical protein